MAEPSRPSKHWFSRSGNSKKESHPKHKHGGMLDHIRVLEETFVKSWESRDLEEEVKKEFPQVRLAVFGRSGAGKSTLIRLIIGSDVAGAQSSISDGTAGTQDINDEWSSPDSDLPLLIHDSNGMDIKGQERVDTIKKFLDKHQQSSNISERIHLVWYVMSAIDRRFLDDGDVLKLVCSYEIPFLLIITHNDCVVKGKEIVTESTLDKLLEGVPEKASVKKHMVTVGNGVRVENGQFIEEDVDQQALQRLNKNTMKLIDIKRRYVWAAAQARDMHEKLEASATLIVRYARSCMVSSIVTAIPIAEQAKLVFSFRKVLTSLCKIWRVPPNLRIVLFKDIAFPEGTKSLLSDLFRSLVAAAGFVASVAATVATVGLAMHSIFAWMAASGAANSRSSTVLFLGFSSVILGCILYVKANQKSSKIWDPEGLIDGYRVLCKEFADSKYQNDLPKRVAECRSSWDTLLRSGRQAGRIKSQIVEFYKEMLKRSPRSLSSQIENEKVQEQGQSHLAKNEKAQEKGKESISSPAKHAANTSLALEGAYGRSQQQIRTPLCKDQNFEPGYNENIDASHDGNSIRYENKDQRFDIGYEGNTSIAYDANSISDVSKNTKSNTAYDDNINTGNDDDVRTAYEEDVNIDYDENSDNNKIFDTDYDEGIDDYD